MPKSHRGQSPRLPPFWQKVLGTDFGVPSYLLSCWPIKLGIPFCTAPQPHPEGCTSFSWKRALSYPQLGQKDKADLMSLKKALVPRCRFLGKGSRPRGLRSAHFSDGVLRKAARPHHFSLHTSALRRALR